MTMVLVQEYRATALQGYGFYCTACFFRWPWSSVLECTAHGVYMESTHAPNGGGGNGGSIHYWMIMD